MYTDRSNYYYRLAQKRGAPVAEYRPIYNMLKNIQHSTDNLAITEVLFLV